MSTGGCLAGRTAVVTGSASGIGRATALRLAQAGANLIVSACKSKDAANALAQELRGLSVEATVLMVDLADPAATRTFIEQAWAWQRGVDIWVNNAGGSPLQVPLTELPIDEWNATLALNLADHAYLLETGNVVRSGESSIIRDDENVRRVYLGY